MVTPEGVPLRFELARVGDRAVAFALDCALLVGLCVVLFFVTVFVYAQLYRVMSLNAPKLPLALARLL